MDIIEPIIKIDSKSRIDFLEHVPHNAVCAEIGCLKGRFTWQILTYASPKKLYVIDPYWKKFGDAYYWDESKKTMDCFAKAIWRIRQTEKSDNVTFVIDTDDSFLPDLKDNIFDWIYLDASHKYADTLLELDIIKDKIKLNGLICGHDYGSSKHPGATEAIQEWLVANNDFEFYLLDNHMQWMIRRKLNEK